MAKSYAEQLDEWVEKRPSYRRDRNLVQFLAVRSDVKLAVDKGFAVSTIWRNMVENGRIDFCYDTFLLYVNRVVRGADRVRAPSAKYSKPPARGDVPDTTAARPEPVRGFKFNPFLKKEDLI